MGSSHQYPIGTIFRRSWDEGKTYQEFEVLGYSPDRKGANMRMTYGGLNPTIDYFIPEAILNFGFEVILPKSDNFNSLYNKLNETT